MRKSCLLFLLVIGASADARGIRPLRPLELATGPYIDREVEARTGSLMYEGGCLLFRDDRTRAHFVPVWPTGSIFNGTSVIFHQPGKDEQRIVLGEEVVIAGQAAQWPTAVSAFYTPFSNQCGAQPFFVSRVRPAD